MANKHEWWKTRAALNDQLRDLCGKLEESWLGPWKVRGSIGSRVLICRQSLLLGTPSSPEAMEAVEERAAEFAGHLSKALKTKGASIDQRVVELCLSAAPFMSPQQISACICALLGWDPAALTSKETGELKSVRVCGSPLVPFSLRSLIDGP